MAKSSQKSAVLTLLRQASGPLSLNEIATKINWDVSDRTLRRWLVGWVASQAVRKTGSGPATVYQYIAQHDDTNTTASAADSFAFLAGLDADLRASLLKQIRDLWTHSSTALEGNTLSLGDTHFILEEGLTISGKPVRDHMEVRGHARAIDLLYQSLGQPIGEEIVFALHRAVQTEHIDDIYKPIGAWKIEANGTHTIGSDNKPRFVEYAQPLFVAQLMAEVFGYINSINPDDISLSNAAQVYAKVHMGVAHIHPFWDGNGRIARLLANIPLLKAGLPPLVIAQEQRRTYIQTLSSYQISIGPLTSTSGVWPDPHQLQGFNRFCDSCYGSTKELVEQAVGVQAGRVAG